MVEHKLPLPNLLKAMASSIFLYGMMVLTGPKASTSCASVAANGCSFINNTGDINAPFVSSASTTSTLSNEPYIICDDANNFCTCAFTSSRWEIPANEPILTFSFSGLPITVLDNDSLMAFHTSSILFLGTKILRIPVQRCPAFNVISFLISFIKMSHSGIPGCTSSPKTIQFNESASILKGTASCKICGLDFNNNPVAAEPVNVTTSWEVT